MMPQIRSTFICIPLTFLLFFFLSCEIHAGPPPPRHSNVIGPYHDLIIGLIITVVTFFNIEIDCDIDGQWALQVL